MSAVSPIELAAQARLVELARAGETSAFAELYDTFAPRLHAHARRLLGSRQDADDIVQDTFLRAWRKLGELREPESIESWLYAIASRRCLDILRRRRILGWVPLIGRIERQADDCEERVADRDLVRAALVHLSPAEAVCLTLREIEGYSCQEIAQMLGCSETSVWSRLYRGRQRFLEAYERARREASLS